MPLYPFVPIPPRDFLQCVNDILSYIVQAEIHSGINMCPEVGCHCIAIGKGTSVADGVLLIIDLDHDFNSVVQGDLKSLGGLMGGRTRRRGSIILLFIPIGIGRLIAVPTGLRHLHSVDPFTVLPVLLRVPPEVWRVAEAAPLGWRRPCR